MAVLDRLMAASRISCPACNSDALQPLYADSQARVNLCGTSTLMCVAYVDAPPAPERVFTREHFQRNYLGTRETQAIPLWNEILDALERIVPARGNLVDVGCGVGTFLLQARRRGWDGRGVDISPDAVALACDRGLPVETGRLAELAWPAGGTGVLTFFESLAYERDLYGTLETALRLPSAVGVLAVKAHWLTPRSVRLLHLVSRALGRRPPGPPTMPPPPVRGARPVRS